MTITKTAAKALGLPVGSANFFEGLAADAGNWSGMPLIDGGRSAGGYTAKLVAAGLITSEENEGDTFASFTPAGVALAAKMGIDLSAWYEGEGDDAEPEEIGATIKGLPTVAAPKKVCKKGEDHEFRITKSGHYCYTCDREAAEAQKAARAAAKEAAANA